MRLAVVGVVVGVFGDGDGGGGEGDAGDVAGGEAGGQSGGPSKKGAAMFSKGTAVPRPTETLVNWSSSTPG